ncbi:MAG TPA: AAA family ATPase, partial [Gammaproteobacteria bacterium]|nr:AAA family ATPase [Gammaproteobacteria bacterium]
PDGALIGYFGLEAGSERAVSEAGAAALSLQERMELYPGGAVRIGFHSDWALMGKGGHPDYLGTVVRRARSAALSGPPGRARVTEELRHRLPRVLRTQAVAERDDHGPLHALVAGSPAIGAPLVGRRPELARLLRAARGARNGHGVALAVVGEAGIGKTRLLQALKGRMSGRLRSLRMRARQGEAGMSLAPFSGLLEALCGDAPEVGDGERRGRVRAFLEGVPELAPEHRAVLLQLLPGEPSAPEERRDPLPALEALFRELARTPLMLQFEDLHWADGASRQALERLAGLVRELPLLLVVTSRPEAAPQWSEREVLPLDPLTLGAVEDLVGRIAIGKALPREQREAIARLSEGVPLYAEELVQGWANGDGKTLSEVPGTLNDLFSARLDAMGAAKRTAQVGALVGRGFTPELIAWVDRRDPEGVRADLEALCAADLVREGASCRRKFFHVKHALLEEGIYATLPQGERTVLHGRIARLLENGYPVEGPVRP